MRLFVGRAALAAAASDRPRVRVSALVVLEGRVVLVRHRAGASAYHLLPGGGVGYRETLEHALVREVREETGLEVTLGELLFVNDTIDPAGTRHVVNMTFRAQIVGGHVTDAPEDKRVEAVDLVWPESLSEMDLRPPLASAIQRTLAGEQVAPGYLGSLFTEGR
jgi:ADP-ribose pyrophosphatase YjhB (NUDIX family)